MKLENYKQLIQNLPVRQQSFTVKRANKKWLEAEIKFKLFKDFNDKYFTNGQLQISRQDIFDIKNSPKEKIIKTILWGYPNGMQGGHKSFAGILDKLNTLSAILSELQNSNDLEHDDLIKAQNNFKPICGVGLSTYSKLLYFFDIKISKIPCLIMDKRLLDVIQSNIFSDFNEHSKKKKVTTKTSISTI